MRFRKGGEVEFYTGVVLKRRENRFYWYETQAAEGRSFELAWTTMEGESFKKYKINLDRKNLPFIRQQPESWLPLSIVWIPEQVRLQKELVKIAINRPERIS